MLCHLAFQIPSKTKYYIHGLEVMHLSQKACICTDVSSLTYFTDAKYINLRSLLFHSLVNVYAPCSNICKMHEQNKTLDK